MDDLELERQLEDLKWHIAYPEVDVTATVSSRLADSKPVTLKLIAAMTLLVLLGAISALPDAQQAVARLFGVRGVQIETGGTEVPVDVGALSLGEEISLAEAQVRAGFTTYVPSVSGLRSPRVFLESGSNGNIVHLLYPPADSLPATSQGPGMLITQFEADLDRAPFGKTAFEGTKITDVSVGPHPGVWLSGQIHTVFYRQPDGSPIQHTIRLAGNTLLWEIGAVTLRLEAEITLEQALRIARGMRRLEP